MNKINNIPRAYTLILAVVLQLTSITVIAQLKLQADSFLNSNPSKHRKINLKQYVIPASTMFISGLLDGTIEAIKFHYYSGFKRRFKNANDQFWNPDMSWTNKYKNGNPDDGPKFFESTNSLVFTTDAYHGLRTAKNLVNTFTITFYINRARKDLRKMKFKKVLLDALILTTIRNIGFTTTYSILFKPQIAK